MDIAIAQTTLYFLAIGTADGIALFDPHGGGAVAPATALFTLRRIS